MKIITIEEINRRIQEHFPNQPYEIIEYTKVTKPFTIKCLQCGEINTYASFDGFYSGKKYLCYCYNLNDNKTKSKINKEKIIQLIEQSPNELIEFGKNESKKKTVSVKCAICEQIFTKTFQSFLKDQSCYYCQNKQKMNTQAFKALLPKEYTLLSEYGGLDSKILVRHECGFIWKIGAHGFLHHTGCPKCNKKRSAGERKIQKFLDDHNIESIVEKSFEWQTNPKRRYDFYLPDFNLIIEYMGEQHYRERAVPIFKTTLAEQQRIDEEKRLDAINNGFNYLAISYKDFIRIESILMKVLSSTTNQKGVDFSESKQQTSFQKEEDIV